MGQESVRKQALLIKRIARIACNEDTYSPSRIRIKSATHWNEEKDYVCNVCPCLYVFDCPLNNYYSGNWSSSVMCLTWTLMAILHPQFACAHYSLG